VGNFYLQYLDKSDILLLKSCKGASAVLKTVFCKRNNEHGMSASAFGGTQAFALFDFPDAV
jgi:hypothetical protein